MNIKNGYILAFFFHRPCARIHFRGISLCNNLLIIVSVSIQSVCEVTVFKRPDEYWTQFDTVELRIGNVDMAGSGLVRFIENECIANSGPVSDVVELVFTLQPPVEGRFLTLQTLADQYMSFVEIFAKKLIYV